MEGVLVTAETRPLENGAWECAAWRRGDVVRVTASSEDDAHALFIDTWNSERGTEYGPEDFSFVRQQ